MGLRSLETSPYPLAISLRRGGAFAPALAAVVPATQARKIRFLVVITRVDVVDVGRAHRAAIPVGRARGTPVAVTVQHPRASLSPVGGEPVTAVRSDPIRHRPTAQGLASESAATRLHSRAAAGQPQNPATRTTRRRHRYSSRAIGEHRSAKALRQRGRAPPPRSGGALSPVL